MDIYVRHVSDYQPRELVPVTLLMSFSLFKMDQLLFDAFSVWSNLSSSSCILESRFRLDCNCTHRGDCRNGSV